MASWHHADNNMKGNNLNAQHTVCFLLLQVQGGALSL